MLKFKFEPDYHFVILKVHLAIGINKNSPKYSQEHRSVGMDIVIDSGGGRTLDSLKGEFLAIGLLDNNKNCPKKTYRSLSV